jgi:hypothetical protein
VASSRIEDFAVPNGREEEWRFAPVSELSWFMDLDPDAGSLTAEEGAHVNVVATSVLEAAHGPTVCCRPCGRVLGRPCADRE